MIPARLQREAVLAAVQWIAISWPPLARLLGAVPLSARERLIVLGARVWPVAVLEA
jgi:hypothetical protein